MCLLNVIVPGTRLGGLHVSAPHLKQHLCCLCTAHAHSHVQRSQPVHVASVQQQCSSGRRIGDASLRQQGVSGRGVEDDLQGRQWRQTVSAAVVVCCGCCCCWLPHAPLQTDERVSNEFKFPQFSLLITHPDHACLSCMCCFVQARVVASPV